MRRFLPALVLPLLLAGPAPAADTAWEHGHKLVLINCTRCHAISLAGDSPLPPAPPFREVAKNYSLEELVDGFMEGLAVRHQAMPEWQMSDTQAEDIATYILSLAPGLALDPASPAAQGFAMLHDNCARCHAAGAEGASPLAKAPPFREVVKKYDPAQLEEALAEGIVTGHNEMPEFEFSPDEVSSIVSYLEALRQR
jgi:mono/diheme cytochrome c family protein